MKILWKVVAFVVGMIFPLVGFSYIVRSGDTVSSIARENGIADYRSICSLNGLRDCGRISVGQVLRLPENGKGKEKEVLLTPMKSLSDTHSWRRVGADPVLKGWVRKSWLNTEEVKLAPEQETSLRVQGLQESHIVEVKEKLRTKEYQLVFRPIGYTWESIGFASGSWRATKNETGDAVPVFALHALSDGTQVDLALGCGNPGVNHVEIPKEKPILSEKPSEKQLACERVGAFWAQVTGNGVSGTARFACLFQVSQDWKVGPTVGIGGSRYHEGWIELQNFFGGGVEIRGKNVAGFEAVEFVVMVGPGSAEGHSPDKLVEKLKATGLDLQLAAQLRQTFKIDKETSVTVRLMPFASVPLTGKEADILWKGMLVKQENGRHLTVGTTLRFELRKKGLGFKPELTLGIWRMSDVDNPIGWKVLAGLSTLDNVWRVGAGFQFPGRVWVVEVEWNPAWGWLQLNAREAQQGLTKDAQLTCNTLRMSDCPSLTSMPGSTLSTSDATQAANAEQPVETRMVVIEKKWCGKGATCLTTEIRPVAEGKVLSGGEIPQDTQSLIGFASR